MKQFILGLMIIFSFKAFSTAGEGAGNGGGGVLRDGIAQTFYSAGVRVSPIELTSLEIPELETILGELYFMPGLPSPYLRYLSEAINPTIDRKYFNLDESQMGQAELERLTLIYKELTGLKSEKIEIFAITDPKTKTTYIRPSFYKLNSVEKMAILIHEAYWINDPQAEYKEVLKIERDFQSYLENKKSPVAIMRFLENFIAISDMINTAFEIDLKLGNLPEFVEENGDVVLSTLLGDKFIDLYDAGKSFSVLLITENLMKLRYENPKSLLMKIIFDFSATLNVGLGKSHKNPFGKHTGTADVFDSRYVNEEVKPILKKKINLLEGVHRYRNFSEFNIKIDMFNFYIDDEHCFILKFKHQLHK